MKVDIEKVRLSKGKGKTKTREVNYFFCYAILSIATDNYLLSISILHNAIIIDKRLYPLTLINSPEQNQALS